MSLPATASEDANTASSEVRPDTADDSGEGKSRVTGGDDTARQQG